MIDDGVAKNEGGSLQSFSPYLHSILKNRMGDGLQRDHSDIVQQTLLEAHHESTQGKAPVDPRHYRHWLRKILLCNVTDAMRKSLSLKRNSHREVRFVDERSEHSTPHQLATDHSSPSEVFSRNERSSTIHAAIEQMPEVNQQVIQLRFFDGLSTQEIAELIGRTDRAVAGLLYRSLSKLKELLAEDSSC